MYYYVAPQLDGRYQLVFRGWTTDIVMGVYRNAGLAALALRRLQARGNRAPAAAR